MAVSGPSSDPESGAAMVLQEKDPSSLEIANHRLLQNCIAKDALRIGRRQRHAQESGQGAAPQRKRDSVEG